MVTLALHRCVMHLKFQEQLDMDMKKFPQENTNQ